MFHPLALTHTNTPERETGGGVEEFSVNTPVMIYTSREHTIMHVLTRTIMVYMGFDLYKRELFIGYTGLDSHEQEHLLQMDTRVLSH